MKTKISAYVKKGGNKDKLWETVRHAEKREGVVVCVGASKDESGDLKMDIDAVTCNGDIKPVTKTKKARYQWNMDRLNTQLEHIVQEREKVKKEMDVVLWRTRLLELATARSEATDECAWDQRLCFGDEEYMEFGADTLASYGDGADKPAGKDEGDDAMQVDATPAEDGEWWCTGKRKCERHSG